MIMVHGWLLVSLSATHTELSVHEQINRVISHPMLVTVVVVVVVVFVVVVVVV